MAGITFDMTEISFLVVDDEPFMRTLIQRLLKGFGASDIRVSEDGREALARLETAHPDVVVCDLNMPEMDGIEFLRHLTEADYHGTVILVSGEDQRVLDTASSLAEAHDLTFLGAIPKPIAPGALQDLLNQLPRQEPKRRISRPVAEIGLDRLRQGLEGGAIEVFYQPKIDVARGQVIGAESLVRWREADGSILPPVAFVPLTEEEGLIDPLTDQVIARAIAQAGEWRRKGSISRLR